MRFADVHKRRTSLDPCPTLSAKATTAACSMMFPSRSLKIISGCPSSRILRRLSRARPSRSDNDPGGSGRVSRFLDRGGYLLFCSRPPSARPPGQSEARLPANPSVKNRGRKKRREVQGCAAREIARVSRGRCQSRDVPHHAAANSTLPSKADARRMGYPVRSALCRTARAPCCVASTGERTRRFCL